MLNLALVFVSMDWLGPSANNAGVCCLAVINPHDWLLKIFWRMYQEVMMGPFFYCAPDLSLVYFSKQCLWAPICDHSSFLGEKNAV